jgi:hypothetical protein
MKFVDVEFSAMSGKRRMLINIKMYGTYRSKQPALFVKNITPQGGFYS